MIYTCKCCDYHTNRKSSYDKHLLSNKHKKALEISQSCKKSPKSCTIEAKSCKKSPKSCKSEAKSCKINNLSEVSENKPIYTCEYCSKIYKHKQSLDKHIRSSCLKSKDEELKNCVKLLNETTNIYSKIRNKEEKNKVKIEIDKRNAAIKLLLEKVEKAYSNTDNMNNSNHITKQNKIQQEITNYTNNIAQQNNIKQDITNNIAQQNNVQQNIILNFKDTDISHLTPKDFKQIIGRKINCITEFIRRVHCNDSAPQNMNVYIPNLKNNYIMIYKDGIWILSDRDEIIEDLIENHTCLLEEWIDNNPEKASADLKDTFDEYLDYREKHYTGLNKKLKNEIKKDLYNVRHKINKKTQN